jgi:hypothetical protein
MKVHELNVHEGCAKKCNFMNGTLFKATSTNPINDIPSKTTSNHYRQVFLCMIPLHN